MVSERLVYYFYDTIIYKYSSQDNVQVLAVITTVIEKVKQDFPEIDTITIGSNNASCLASHDSIPYIHLLNRKMEGVQVRNWIYTEACTGENRLDTHFSFVQLKLTAYLLQGKDMTTECDIFQALKF